MRNEPRLFGWSLALAGVAVTVSFGATLLSPPKTSETPGVEPKRHRRRFWWLFLAFVALMTLRRRRGPTRSHSETSPVHKQVPSAPDRTQQQRTRTQGVWTGPFKQVPSAPGKLRQQRTRTQGAWIGPLRIILTIVSFFLFVAAVTMAVIGFSGSLRSADSPRIAATWKAIGKDSNTAVATISVQLSGLRTTDILYVTVEPGTPLVRDNQGGFKGTLAGFLIYRSQTGADPDGKADLSFDVPLPTGWAVLQVVASVNIPRNCEGKAVPGSSGSSGPSNVPFETEAPHFACVLVFGPVSSAVPTPSTTRSG